MRIHFAGLSRPKSIAKSLAAHLPGTKLSEAQRLTAIATGYADWHELQRVTNKKGNKPSPNDIELSGMDMLFRHEDIRNQLCQATPIALSHGGLLTKLCFRMGPALTPGWFEQNRFASGGAATGALLAPRFYQLKPTDSGWPGLNEMLQQSHHDTRKPDAVYFDDEDEVPPDEKPGECHVIAQWSNDHEPSLNISVAARLDDKYTTLIQGNVFMPTKTGFVDVRKAIKSAALFHPDDAGLLYETQRYGDLVTNPPKGAIATMTRAAGNPVLIGDCVEAIDNFLRQGYRVGLGACIVDAGPCDYLVTEPALTNGPAAEPGSQWQEVTSAKAMTEIETLSRSAQSQAIIQTIQLQLADPPIEFLTFANTHYERGYSPASIQHLSPV